MNTVDEELKSMEEQLIYKEEKAMFKCTKEAMGMWVAAGLVLFCAMCSAIADDWLCVIVEVVTAACLVLSTVNWGGKNE